MTKTGILLYDSDGSPCARRVKITLIEKGLPFTSRHIELSRLEQRSPAYLAINPNGLVPTLVHDGNVLWESNVITEYLDDVFPTTQLYPSDPQQRLAAKNWQATELSLAKDFRPLMYTRLMGPMIRFAASLDEVLAKARISTTDPDYLAWEEKVWRLQVLTPVQANETGARLMKYIDTLEAALADQDFLVGNQFTTADLSMYPRVKMYPYIGLPIAATRYPRVNDWMNRLARRRSFLDTRSRMERGIELMVKSGVLADINKLVRDEPVALPRRLLLKNTVRPVLRRILGFSGGVAAGAPLPTPVPRVQSESAPAWFAAIPGTDMPILSGDSNDVETTRLIDLARHINLPLWHANVDTLTFAQHDTALRARNPAGDLPMLDIGGNTLVDGIAIAEMLCACAKRADLIGEDALSRARIRMWLAFDAAMHKEFRPLLQLRVLRPALLARFSSESDYLASLPFTLNETDRDTARALWRGDIRIDMGLEGAQNVLQKRLGMIDARLQLSPAIAGATLTFADLALAKRIQMMESAGIASSASAHGALRDWLARTTKHFDI